MLNSGFKLFSETYNTIMTRWKEGGATVDVAAGEATDMANKLQVENLAWTESAKKHVFDLLAYVGDTAQTAFLVAGCEATAARVPAASFFVL